MKDAGESKWAISTLVVLAAVFSSVIGYRYFDYVIAEKFLLAVNAPCDPASERCFVYDCSPEDDPECDGTPYKKVEIRAHDAPACLLEHACESFACSGREESCSVSYCEAETMEEWEICIGPEASMETEKGEALPDTTNQKSNEQA